jgi:hypothetical protein
VEVNIKLKDNFTEHQKTNFLEQLRSYMDICKAKEGWLAIFDINCGNYWKDKIS